MSGVLEVAWIWMIMFGPDLNIDRLNYARRKKSLQKLFIKNSNLKLFLLGTVVVHDAQVMVIGLVVHDQAGESWEMTNCDSILCFSISPPPSLPPCCFGNDTSCPSLVIEQKTPSFFFSANDSGYFRSRFPAPHSGPRPPLASHRLLRNHTDSTLISCPKTVFN